MFVVCSIIAILMDLTQGSLVDKASIITAPLNVFLIYKFILNPMFSRPMQYHHFLEKNPQKKQNMKKKT